MLGGKRQSTAPKHLKMATPQAPSPLPWINMLAELDLRERFHILPPRYPVLKYTHTVSYEGLEPLECNVTKIYITKSLTILVKAGYARVNIPLSQIRGELHTHRV